MLANLLKIIELERLKAALRTFIITQAMLLLRCIKCFPSFIGGTASGCSLIRHLIIKHLGLYFMLDIATFQRYKLIEDSLLLQGIQSYNQFSRSVMSDSLPTPWTAACQACLSFAISWSLLKLISIELVMPSNCLILCHPLLLLPSIFPSDLSNKLALHIRQSQYWSFSFSSGPSNEYSGLVAFRIDWFDLLAVQESSPTPQFKSISSLALSLFSMANIPELQKMLDYLCFIYFLY